MIAEPSNEPLANAGELIALATDIYHGRLRITAGDSDSALHPSVRMTTHGY